MTTDALADGESEVVKCPSCDDPLERVSRSALMRTLIGSKRYYCWFCHRGYLYFLGHLFPPRR